MIKEIKEQPKFWLNLELCERLFNKTNASLELIFNEPIPPFETRYPGKLESILDSVKQTYGGKHLNPTIIDAATAYFYQFSNGHPFQNGNKRMAVLFTHSFLLLNQLDFKLNYEEVFALSIRVVENSQKMKSDMVKTMLRKILSEGIEVLTEKDIYKS